VVKFSTHDLVRLHLQYVSDLTVSLITDANSPIDLPEGQSSPFPI